MALTSHAQFASIAQMKAPHASSSLFAAIVAVASIAPAADPPDMIELKTQYQIAIAQAVQKNTEVYKDKLLALKKQYSDVKDNAGIIAIASELVRLGVTSSLLPPVRTTNAFSGAIPGGGLGDEKYYADKNWVVSGTKSDFHFNKDGTGWRKGDDGAQAPLTWKKLDSGLIQASGSVIPGGPPRQWYFKFDNDKTAFYGLSPASMPTKLEAD